MSAAFQDTTHDAMVSHVVTHLHLLRHGRVDTGGRRLAYGWSDLPLSEQGRRESEAMLAFAQASLPKPDGIISSDLRRCLDLAEPLAAALGVPLRIQPELREQNMGAWEGEAWDDLQARWGTAVNDYWDDYVHAAPPEGENVEQVGDRVDGWWNEVWPELEGGRWFVVGHAGVVRSLLCRFLGLPRSEALRFAPPHGSHTQVLLAEAGAVIQTLGQLPTATVMAEQYVAGPKARVGRRLALSGSAGIGKSTLGRELAERLGVPFIDEGMRRRLEAGLQLHGMSEDRHRALLVDLWEEQVREEDAAVAEFGGFVADRSSVDFAAFALLFHSHVPEFCEAFVPRVLSAVSRYDAVIVLPWGVLPLQADGYRSTNRWYQRRFQSTVEGLVRREVPPGRAWFLPGLSELEERLTWVQERVG